MTQATAQSTVEKEHISKSTLNWKVAPFIVFVAEEYSEDVGGMNDVFMSKTSTPEKTDAGNGKTDTEG